MTTAVVSEYSGQLDVSRVGVTSARVVDNSRGVYWASASSQEFPRSCDCLHQRFPEAMTLTERCRSTPHLNRCCSRRPRVTRRRRHGAMPGTRLIPQKPPPRANPSYTQHRGRRSRLPVPLALDIGRSLQFFFTSTPYHNVQHILLFGGSAILEGLTSAIQNETKVSTLVLDPFLGMELGSSINKSKIRKAAPAYLTACGLALRRFSQ